MQSIPKLLITGFWQLLYPPRCGCCGSPVSALQSDCLCTSCSSQITFLHSPLCCCCGAGLSPDAGVENRWCGSCLKKPPVFDTARSLFAYQGPVRTLLHRLKYASDTRAALTMGSLIEQAGDVRSKRAYDLIIPVPLFRSRLRQRGLNQALVLAKMIFPGQKEKIEPMLLIRVKNTLSQTRLSGKERRKNLRGAFAINPGSAPVAGRVCLVDDIFTTGTTATECTRILKKNGADSVDILTCARA